MAGVGFIGLGAMGFGMATNLLTHPQYSITGFDVFTPKMDQFRERGGATAASPWEVGRRSNFLICMAANSKQVHDILFNNQTGALPVLPRNAIVLVCSTVNPTFHDELAKQITDSGRSDVHVLDCPVSGGTKRAAEGTLTIFASGDAATLVGADGLLKSMSEVLNVVPGGAGAASKIKTVNQLLVGIHIAAAAEVMAMAARAGLNTRQVYDLIVKSSGNSWAFENRVPHMIQGDWTPHSAVDIFVKDMGIVIDSARELQFPLPMSSSVEQLYTFASGQGYGKEDDAGVVRIFLPSMTDAIARLANATEQETASFAKLLASMLAGIHAAAAAEAFLFAQRLGLDLHAVLAFLKSAAAWSWQFERIGAQLLDGGAAITGQLFPADLLADVEVGLKEARRLCCYVPILSSAHVIIMCACVRPGAPLSGSHSA